MVRRFISAVIIGIFTGDRFYDTDWRNGNMATKRLKTVDSQRKITDFAFGKPESAQPNTTSRPQDISDQEVPEIVDNEGDSAPETTDKQGEKRDFQYRWLQQHHWLQYD